MCTIEDSISSMLDLESRGEGSGGKPGGQLRINRISTSADASRGGTRIRCNASVSRALPTNTDRQSSACTLVRSLVVFVVAETGRSPSQ